MTSGPIAICLFYFTLRLWKKMEEKDASIEKMNVELRDLERNQVEIQTKLIAAIDNLSELIIKETLRRK